MAQERSPRLLDFVGDEGAAAQNNQVHHHEITKGGLSGRGCGCQLEKGNCHIHFNRALWAAASFVSAVQPFLGKTASDPAALLSRRDGGLGVPMAPAPPGPAPAGCTRVGRWSAC